MRSKRFTEEQERQICQEYLGGVGCNTIAKKWGATSRTIWNIIARHGYKLRSFSEAARLRENRKPKTEILEKLKIIQKVQDLQKKGFRVKNICKDLGIVHSTYYGWKRKYQSKEVGKSGSVLI